MLSPILWSKVWAFPWLTPSREIHSRRSNILCDLNIERGMGFTMPNYSVHLQRDTSSHLVGLDGYFRHSVVPQGCWYPIACEY